MIGFDSDLAFFWCSFCKALMDDDLEFCPWCRRRRWS